MNYVHDHVNGIAIFNLEGNLMSDDDRAAIKQAFEEDLDNGESRFIIDMSQLQHMNSTGIGVFITLYTKVRSRGGEMVIVNPTDNIRNLLSITKLDAVFTILPDRNQARLHLGVNTKS